MLKNFTFIISLKSLKLNSLFKNKIFNFRVKSSTNQITSKEKFSLKLGLTKETNEKEKENNIFYAKSEIIFNDGKFGVIKTTGSNTIKFSKINRILITSIFTIAASTSLFSLLIKSYMMFSISGVVTLITLYLRSILYKNLSRLTIELNLMEDGKSVEIVTFSKKFVVDIKSIKVPNKIQNIALANINPDIANQNTPFVVDDGPHKGFYYIPPQKEIQQKNDILHAIFNKERIYFQKNPKSF